MRPGMIVGDSNPVEQALPARAVPETPALFAQSPTRYALFMLTRPTHLALLALAVLTSPALAQRAANPWTPPDTTKLPAPATPDERAPDDPARIFDAINRSVELLLARQEDMDAGDKPAPQTKVAGSEWPYEGVYRVNRQIPLGYRIGGTSIAATCLLRAPGYTNDPNRKHALARAVAFICQRMRDPLMSVDTYTAGYDVRGWGYTCALAFLLELKAAKAIPADSADTVESTITWTIDAIQRTEIPTVGGWNYAREPGADTPCPASPFMTGPTLQALFEAKKQGCAIDDAVLTRALDALERCRSATGSYAYSADTPAATGRPEPVPGSVGRMLAGEIALYLAGRSDPSRIRGALDAFFAHWAWLDQRRAKTGTHMGPYGVAPYYFYYAHLAAAQAIELLPRSKGDLDRKDYRRRLAQLLFSVQLEDGSWNDRVFPRTANYGTSIAAMSLLMPSSPPLARMTPTPPPDAEPR